MKKTVCSFLVAILLIASVATLIACTEESDSLVSSYTIDEVKVNIGDAFGKPTVTANMSDGTTKTISNNLVYDEADIEKLKLDENDKYTTAGEYTVKVYILEQQDKFYLGDWKITVKVTK